MCGCVVEIFLGQVLVWCGSIIGNSTGSSIVCGLVGPWNLLRVDPGLNGTRCFKHSMGTEGFDQANSRKLMW